MSQDGDIDQLIASEMDKEPDADNESAHQTAAAHIEMGPAPLFSDKTKTNQPGTPQFRHMNLAERKKIQDMTNSVFNASLCLSLALLAWVVSRIYSDVNYAMIGSLFRLETVAVYLYILWWICRLIEHSVLRCKSISTDVMFFDGRWFSYVTIFIIVDSLLMALVPIRHSAIDRDAIFDMSSTTLPFINNLVLLAIAPLILRQYTKTQIDMFAKYNLWIHSWTFLVQPLLFSVLTYFVSRYTLAPPYPWADAWTTSTHIVQMVSIIFICHIIGALLTHLLIFAAKRLMAQRV